MPFAPVFARRSAGDNAATSLLVTLKGIADDQVIKSTVATVPVAPP